MSLSGATTLKRFFQFIAVILILTWAVSPPALAQNNNAAANKLFVETVRLVQKADAEKSPKERVRLYTQALKNLDWIVSKYPYTDLSVKLTTNQPIGDFSRTEVQEKLKKAQCVFNPSPCILDQARQILQQAILISQIIPKPEHQVEPLSAIATAQGKLGEIELAKETIIEAKFVIQNKMKKIYGYLTYNPLINAQIKIGDIPNALTTLNRAENDENIRFLTYIKIAETPSKMWDFPEPEKSTKKILDTFVLEKIADKLIQIKKYSEVLKVLQNLKHKPAALSKMAEAYFQLGKGNEAMQAIREAEIQANNLTNLPKDLNEKGWVLANIAVAYRTLGNSTKAREMLESSYKASIKSEEASQSTSYELLSTAKLLSERKLSPEDTRIITLVIKSINSELSTTKMAPDFDRNEFEFDAMLLTAANLIKEKELNREKESLLLQTRNKVEKSQDPLKRLSWKFILAKLEILIGTEEKAKVLVAEILAKKKKFGYDKNKYLREIAKLQASMNDVQGALNTVKSMDLDSGLDRVEAVALKATTLAEIAAILAEKNKKK